MNNQKKNLNWKYKPLAMAITAFISPSLFANATTIIDAPQQILPSQEQRLGDLLTQTLSQSGNSNHYEEALTWQSTAQEAQQNKQHKALVLQLQALQQNQESLTPLFRWIRDLPVTGRVKLPVQDARYLQTHPEINPIVKQGDVVHIHQRPDVVSVLFDNAQACRVSYVTGAQASDYINSCMAQLNNSFAADNAYLISPDGSVDVLPIAKWNAKDAIFPKPGAWLWVPNMRNGWTNQQASEVAHFLATQGMDLPLPFGQNETPIQLKQNSLKSSRDLPATSSDWGITGLLQTPTARMQKAGTTGIHISHTDPYTKYNITLQPFDWLETAVRYTNIDGISYGTASPNQDFKDKSLDIKLRLLKESRLLPEVAVGWRDPVGTSLFGGEYIVANKRYGNFDLSLGLGWGYLGKRGNIDNPLGSIANRYKTRVNDVNSEGGEASPNTWFTGPASLFGGVQWHSPYQPLIVKLEYDGNDYKKEPHNLRDQHQSKVPVNFGLTWLGRNLELNAGLERGDTATFGIAIRGDLSQLGQVKTNNKATDAVQKRAKLNATNYSIALGKMDKSFDDRQKVLDAINQVTGWKAFELIQQNHIVTLKAEDDQGIFVHERLKSALEVLNYLAPKETKLFQVQLFRYGVPVSNFSIKPEQWRQQYKQLLPDVERIAQPITVTPAKNTQGSSKTTAAKIQYPRGHISLAPAISQSIGGPDGYLFALFANANAQYRLWPGSWVNATAQYRVIDNYDHYKFMGHSDLPRVRTQIHNYMTSSRLLMPNLQWTQFKKLDDNLYGLAYAGYLEAMYAGVGGEILYRPSNASWAIGFDINHVRQRDFDQKFSLRDYKVTTGHLNMYWNTPWYDITAKASAGQYLAGDKGVTLDLSRRFKNGVTMGAWVTKTNVPSEKFGEGSFDKGVYVTIPFDAIFQKWSAGSTRIEYHPLLRDGGAKLSRAYTLYNLTSPSSKDSLNIRNPLGD